MACPFASLGGTDSNASNLIPLQLMPQQAYAGPGNDWTGTSDPKARKKIQDRIHQKARRQRIKVRTSYLLCPLQKGHSAPVGLANIPCSGASEGQAVPSLWASNVGYDSRQEQPFSLSTFTACEPDSERTERFILQFTAKTHQHLLHGSPRTDMLINLVQFNTTRALVMNARDIGVTRELMAPGSRSQLTSGSAGVSAYSSLPPSLRPTHLQLSISHHPWIDTLPLPEIRDNLLRRDESSYDKRELCRDLRGFQAVADGYGGMIVWGAPWDSQGWEVTDAFATKWPWVINGCHQLLKSTNYWRKVRHEHGVEVLPCYTA